MALIERHPDVEDYFVELSLPEIRARGGVADLVEEGKLVLIKDYRLAVDFAAIERMQRSTDAIADADLRRQIKKLEAPNFFDGASPRWTLRGRRFADPLRQALFDVLCHGDRAMFERVGKALRHAHEEVLRLFDVCYAGYEPYRIVPSVRLTETLFENLHWDDHSIDDDFHQARIFANLDTRPRIWHLSHRITNMMRTLYEEHDLGRFAGQDPNKMLFYINSTVLGGQRDKWMDRQPRHRVAFDPGEVWLGESRLISHQIYYGQSALVYMWFMRATSMKDPENRFNAQVEAVHAAMAAREPRAGRPSAAVP